MSTATISKPRGYRALVNGNMRRYMKDGKFIKADNIPAPILQILQTQDFVSTDEPAPTSRNCLFCDEPDCKLTRFVNTQTVYLCEKDNYDNNIGKIAQRMREKAGDEKES